MIAFAEPVSDASHIAESLTGRSYLSWSAISTYLKCPLKYQFHDLDQLPEEFVSANLVFGAAIHAALEAFFGEHLASRRSLNVEALLAVYHSTWSQADLAAVQFGKSEDLASLGLLADRMLQAFVASDLSRPAGSIVGHRHEIGEQLLEQIDRLFDERCVDHNGESQAMSDLACPVDHLHLFVQELLGRNQPAMSLTSSPLRSVRLGRARYTGPPPSPSNVFALRKKVLVFPVGSRGKLAIGPSRSSGKPAWLPSSRWGMPRPARLSPG